MKRLLVYGSSPGHNVVFLQVATACKFARLHHAALSSKTWGELKRKLPPREFDGLVGQDHPSFLDLIGSRINRLGDLDKKSAVAAFGKLWQEFRDLPIGDRVPRDEDTFDFSDISGEGEWPQWTEDDWMPQDMVRDLGVESGWLNGPQIVFPEHNKTFVLDRFRNAGFDCLEAEEVVNLALGNGYGGICNEVTASLLIHEIERHIPPTMVLGPDEYEAAASPVTRAGIDYVLEAFREVESVPANELIQWPDSQTTSEPLKYHPAVERMVCRLHANGFLMPFEWNWEADAIPYLNGTRAVETADLSECIRLLTVHVDRERLERGHFGHMLSGGVIGRVMHRLEQLKVELPASDGNDYVLPDIALSWKFIQWFPLRPSDVPKKAVAVTTASDPDLFGKRFYNDRYTVDRLVICRRCSDLKGEWGSHVQLCDCEQADIKYTPRTMTKPEMVRLGLAWELGRDLNRGAELCRCCGVEVLSSGSRYSVWFCPECRAHVEDANQSAGACVFPVSRYGPANAKWGRTVLSSAEFQRIARSVVRDHIVQFGLPLENDVSLVEYLRVAAGKTWNKSDAFDRLTKRIVTAATR